jgi:hypothetical protein
MAPRKYEAPWSVVDSSIMADATSHDAKRVEHAAQMEVVAVARWASFIERKDIKLELIKASVAAKKRKEDMAMLLVDTSGMDDDVRAWCPDHRTMILSERRAPPETHAAMPAPLHH